MKNLSPAIELMYSNFGVGRDAGIMQLTATNESFDGRILHINNREVVSFCANTYMGFDHDQRVKDAAIEMIQKYGFHTSIPRPYLSFDHYEALEEKLQQIFDLPVFLATTTTNGHFAYLPIIIGKNDAVILDQFVHKSVQMTAQFLRADGVYVEMLRHNQMENLEERIRILRNKYEKIWYLCDGIYSMHGDGSPLRDVEVLLDCYENFYCYVDDAHGMSWIGKNGKGYVFDQVSKHEKMYVITSLNKGFGAFCSAMVFPNQHVKDVVGTIGSTTIFSTCTIHAAIGAASRIADIHLSPEISERQAEMGKRIRLFAKLATEMFIPIANKAYSPIFLVGTGTVENCAIIAKYILDNGFMVGIANYPGVPKKHVGMRVSLSVNQTLDDVRNLAICLNEIYSKLEQEGKLNREAIAQGFKTRSKELVVA